MEEFVASLCSDEWMAWFRRAFDVTRAGDVKLLEKLAVVLQKVSKRRCVCKWAEKLGDRSGQ